MERFHSVNSVSLVPSSLINDKIGAFLLLMMAKLGSYLSISPDFDDFSLYTGVLGCFMTHRRLCSVFKRNCSIILPEMRYSERELSKCIGLCSDYLCFAFYKSLVSRSSCCLPWGKILESNAPSEILYGKAGFILLIKYFRYHGVEMNPTSYDLSTFIDLSAFPWSWHGKEYLGAAHGTVGILHVIGSTFPNLQETVLSLTLSLLKQNFLSSGNLKSSSNSENDKLVQWCHGSPGLIPLLRDHMPNEHLAYYWDVAFQCIFQRGILRKGCGICHGVSGNAYTFLLAFIKSGERQFWDMLLVYLSHILNEIDGDGNFFGSSQADHPYSLFEGFSGTAQLFMDYLMVVEYLENNLHPTFPLPLTLFDGLSIF